jgi:hypothetical protein
MIARPCGREKREALAENSSLFRRERAPSNARVGLDQQSIDSAGSFWRGWDFALTMRSPVAFYAMNPRGRESWKLNAALLDVPEQKEDA